MALVPNVMRTLAPANLAGHFHRVRRARRLGIAFTRRASFQLPTRVSLSQSIVELDLLDKLGTKNDFLGIFLDDMYRLEILRDVARPVRNIVDIGANQGLFTVCARAYFPDAAIHAYEPNPALRVILSTNAGRVGATVFMEAVGAQDGRVRIEPQGDSNLTRVATDPEGDVPMTPFAEVVRRAGGTIDLLKLDCEGWE